MPTGPCPYCKQRINLTAERGEEVRCPSCGHPLRVVTKAPSSPVIPLPSLPSTKACPYCGEQVLAAAIKCKHCGSGLTRGKEDDVDSDFSWIDDDQSLSITGRGSVGSRYFRRKKTAEQRLRTGVAIGCLSVIAIPVVIFLVIIAFSSFDSGKTEPTTYSVPIGGEGRLAADTSGTDVILAVDEAAFSDLVGASDRAVAVMVLNGHLFLAPKGTRVQVLGGNGEGLHRVLVLDGPTIGREGWIPHEFVK